MKRNKKKSPWLRNDLAAVFFVLAVCLLIVWLLIESGGVLFRETSPDTGSAQGSTTTKSVPPITDPPETDPPITNPPVTDPPETDPPETDPPVTNPPVTNPPETDPPVTNPPVTDPPETDPPVTNPPVTNPPETDPPETDPPETDPPETDPPEMDPPETDPPETDPPIVFDPIVVVPESARVDDSYFSDALFIGDSRTVGLSLYSGLRSNYYSEVGLNLSTVFTKGYIGNEKLTLSQALDMNKSFTKVYIAFGINEIAGWPSRQAFFDRYEELIDMIGEKLPYAQIAVQAIIPMSRETAASDRYAAMNVNQKVSDYNAELQRICRDRGIYFIDVYEIFADGNGNLAVTDSGDGIHLGGTSTRKWADYLRTHPLP